MSFSIIFEYVATDGGSDIERQDNAKRIMLIGSMLLHMLDLLEKLDLDRDESHKLLRSNSTEIPNLSIILSHYLQAIEDFKGTCRLNEDGWKHLLLDKADKHGIEIRGLSETERLVNALRNETERDDTNPYEESGNRSKDSLIHWSNCYKREELWGTLTVEKLTQGTRRSWLKYDFFKEVSNRDDRLSSWDANVGVVA